MKLGPYAVDVPVMLAPMAGVTDAAFRLICREEGAAFTCTELSALPRDLPRPWCGICGGRNDDLPAAVQDEPQERHALGL